MVSQENADVREIKEELSSQEEERFSSEIFSFFFFSQETSLFIFKLNP